MASQEIKAELSFADVEAAAAFFRDFAEENAAAEDDAEEMGKALGRLDELKAACHGRYK